MIFIQHTKGWEFRSWKQITCYTCDRYLWLWGI